MVWSLRVETKGPSLETVVSEHSTTVKKSKVDEKTIQASRMEFGENWEYRSDSRVREGYVATTEIAFKLKEFENYKPLWLGLAKIHGVSISAVTYDHTRRIEFQNESRRKAVLAARDKARALAEALGAVIGEPLMIEEDLSPSEGWQFQRNTSLNNLRAADAEAQGQSTGLAPGTIPITVRVKAAFRLTGAGR
jgi:uncharacterized protein YggE